MSILEQEHRTESVAGIAEDHGRYEADRHQEYRWEVEETKEFFRTSEFWIFTLAFVAVLLAAYSSGRDSLSNEDGWRFAIGLAAAYVLSRGIAKAGTFNRDRR